jgi:hypothetical protein
VGAGGRQTETLKRKLALATKQRVTAEAQCNDCLKKDQNLFSVIDQAAIFILRSLKLQKKDPSKEEVSSQASALNGVIRKIANISQDMAGIRPGDEPAQQTMAKREVPRKWVNSGKATNTAKLRKKRQRAGKTMTSGRTPNTRGFSGKTQRRQKRKCFGSQGKQISRYKIERRRRPL